MAHLIYDYWRYFNTLEDHVLYFFEQFQLRVKQPLFELVKLHSLLLCFLFRSKRFIFFGFFFLFHFIPVRGVSYSFGFCFLVILLVLVIKITIKIYRIVFGLFDPSSGFKHGLFLRISFHAAVLCIIIIVLTIFVLAIILMTAFR